MVRGEGLTPASVIPRVILNRGITQDHARDHGLEAAPLLGFKAFCDPVILLGYAYV